MSLLNRIIDIIKKPFHKKNEDFMDYEDEEWQPEPEPEPDYPSVPLDDGSSSIASSPGFMQSFAEMPQSKRLLIMAALGAIVAGGLVFGIRFVQAPMKGNKAPAPQQVSTDNTKKADTSPLSMETAAGTVMVNPFVEVSEGTTAAQVAAHLPQIPGGNVPTSIRYSGNGSLPPIPSYNPRPSLPSGVPMPASSPGNAAPPVPTAAQPTIQGVVTGGDGNNMAIMSDGSVVSAGESYRDGRVAYIGGDGIKFENGSSMKFNQ